MIKKSLFEQELMAGMQSELRKNASNQQTDDLSQAVDYLNSAIDIFEDAGLHNQADQILKLLYKLATHKPRQYFSFNPTHEYIEAQKKTIKPDEQFKRFPETEVDWARYFDHLRQSFKTEENAEAFEKELRSVSGESNYQSPEDTDNILLSIIEEKTFIPSEISGESVLQAPSEEEFITFKPISPKEEFLTFKRLEASKRRPKDPRKISDRHTKNLTSKKMIENLKHHGTPFNMADTHHADDPYFTEDLIVEDDEGDFED